MYHQYNQSVANCYHALHWFAEIRRVFTSMSWGSEGQGRDRWIWMVLPYLSRSVNIRRSTEVGRTEIVFIIIWWKPPSELAQLLKVACYTNFPKHCKNSSHGIGQDHTHYHGQVNYLDLEHGQLWSKINSKADLMTHWWPGVVWTGRAAKCHTKEKMIVEKIFKIYNLVKFLSNLYIIYRRSHESCLAIRMQVNTSCSSCSRIAGDLLLLLHCNLVIRWKEEWHQVQSLTHLHRLCFPCHI